MSKEKPKTGKRIQIYLAGRHAEWWDKLPRYDRSRIVAEALDLYRKQESKDEPESSSSDQG